MFSCPRTCQNYVSEAIDEKASFDACTLRAITDRFQAECEAVAALHTVAVAAAAAGARLPSGLRLEACPMLNLFPYQVHA